jgi:hypothetical protein
MSKLGLSLDLGASSSSFIPSSSAPALIPVATTNSFTWNGYVWNKNTFATGNEFSLRFDRSDYIEPPFDNIGTITNNFIFYFTRTYQLAPAYQDKWVVATQTYEFYDDSDNYGYYVQINYDLNSSYFPTALNYNPVGVSATTLPGLFNSLPVTPIFGFPATIGISRSNTSIWNGSIATDPAQLGLLFGLGAGATRTFTKQTTDLIGAIGGGDGQNYLFYSFLANKYYKFLFTAPFQGASTMSSPYSQVTGYIGLTSNLGSVQSEYGYMGHTFSNYGFLNTNTDGTIKESCPANHWLAVADAFTGFGDGLSAGWPNNSFLSTDANNFPTTGWTTGITIS